MQKININTFQNLVFCTLYTFYHSRRPPLIRQDSSSTENLPTRNEILLAGPRRNNYLPQFRTESRLAMRIVSTDWSVES